MDAFRAGTKPEMTHDVFLSYASEDKDEVAVPLTEHLTSRGLRVWLDEFELTVGDSLRRSIDKGLSGAAFGVVILSPAYLSKAWTGRELDGLVARDDGSRTLILPVWHKLTREDILQYSPTLADRVAVSTDRGLRYVADQIMRAVERSSTGDAPQDTDRRSVDELKAEELTHLRRQLLSARSTDALEEVLFRTQEYLVRYPMNTEARMLERRIKSALEGTGASASPVMKSPRSYSTLSWVLLLVLLALLLLLWRWLW